MVLLCAGGHRRLDLGAWPKRVTGRGTMVVDWRAPASTKTTRQEVDCLLEERRCEGVEGGEGVKESCGWWYGNRVRYL